MHRAESEMYSGGERRGRSRYFVGGNHALGEDALSLS